MSWSVTASRSVLKDRWIDLRADTCITPGGARELAEEAAHSASGFRLICSHWPNPATHTNKLHFYRAIDPVPAGRQQLDAGEDGLTVHLVAVDEVLRGLREGCIMQSMHASAILLGLAACGRITF